MMLGEKEEGQEAQTHVLTAVPVSFARPAPDYRGGWA
tara:strand:- start:80 stop:190 length:111 start_codon:yes stop_codon:yes gene_type:complete